MESEAIFISLRGVESMESLEQRLEQLRNLFSVRDIGVSVHFYIDDKPYKFRQLLDLLEKGNLVATEEYHLLDREVYQSFMEAEYDSFAEAIMKEWDNALDTLEEELTEDELEDEEAIETE
jgi:hypothetical protein